MRLTATLAAATVLTSGQGTPAGHTAGGGFNSSVALGLSFYLAAYLASLYLFPTRRCRACEGTGQRWLHLFTHACRRCDGTGRVPRLGARLIGRSRR